jgi:hypothetical protein
LIFLLFGRSKEKHKKKKKGLHLTSSKGACLRGLRQKRKEELWGDKLKT